MGRISRRYVRGLWLASITTIGLLAASMPTAQAATVPEFSPSTGATIDLPADTATDAFTVTTADRELIVTLPQLANFQYTAIEPTSDCVLSGDGSLPTYGTAELVISPSTTCTFTMQPDILNAGETLSATETVTSKYGDDLTDGPAAVYTFTSSKPYSTPGNDDLALAEDLSGLAIPSYSPGAGGRPANTTGVTGTTNGATWEAGEPLPPWCDATCAPGDGGSVWYRYTSSDFAGRLGYQLVDPNTGELIDRWKYRVDAYALPQGESYPATAPTPRDLQIAIGNQWPPSDIRHVRMLPGHTVWFQVVPAVMVNGDGSHVPHTSDFRLELFQAPNEQDDIAVAYDQSFTGTDVAGWVSDGDTYHVTSDLPGHAPNTWITTNLPVPGNLTYTITTERLYPDEAPGLPIRLVLYAAPTSARVASVDALDSPPIANKGSVALGDLQRVAVDLDLPAGRYYWSIEQGAAGPAFFNTHMIFTPGSGLSAPDTTITSAPTSPTTDTTLTFAFSSGDPNATFECALDAAAFAACASPAVYPGIAVGDHTFQVRAVGLAGTDPTPAAATVTVEATTSTPPVIAVSGNPSGITTSDHASLTLSADRPVVFSCTASRGGGTAEAWPCDDGVASTISALDLPGLPDGPVQIRIQAVDADGLTSEITVGWDVQAPPVVSITAPRDGDVFHAADVPALAYSCADNSGQIVQQNADADGSLLTSTELPAGVGDHVLSVTCVDPSGNDGTDQITYTVLPDNRPPSVPGTIELTGIPGQSVSTNVLDGVTDPDGDPVRVLTIQKPGTLAPSPSSIGGTFSVSIPPTWTTDLTYTAVIQDVPPTGVTPHTVYRSIHITVTPNQPPSVTDHEYSVRAGQVLRVPAADGVLEGATDPDGDPLEVVGFSVVSGPGGPIPQLRPLGRDGSFTVMPTRRAATGDWVYSVFVEDLPLRHRVTATVTIHVDGNQAPVVGPLEFTVRAGSTLAVPASGGLLSTASDPDGDPLRIVRVGGVGPAPSLRYSRDGSFTLAISSTTAARDFAYDVDIQDVPAAGTPIRVTMRLLIHVVENRLPVGVAHEYRMHAGETLTVDAAAGLLSSVVDPDGDAVQVVRVQGGRPALRWAADGSFSLTIPPGFRPTNLGYAVEVQDILPGSPRRPRQDVAIEQLTIHVVP